MKKIAVVLMLSCLLGGCSGKVDQWQLRKMEEICKDKGGINYILAENFWVLSGVRCVNGDFIIVKSGGK